MAGHDCPVGAVVNEYLTGLMGKLTCCTLASCPEAAWPLVGFHPLSSMK